MYVKRLYDKDIHLRNKSCNPIHNQSSPSLLLQRR